jgi:hypothetical protein
MDRLPPLPFQRDWSIGRLRLLRPGGAGDYLLARGDERTSLAQMGLRPLELSRSGLCASVSFVAIAARRRATACRR